MNDERGGRRWIPASYCERCQCVHEAHWEFRMQDAIAKGVESLRDEIDREVLRNLTK